MVYSHLLCVSGCRTLEGVITRDHRRVGVQAGSLVSLEILPLTRGLCLHWNLIGCRLVVGTRPVLGVSAAFSVLLRDQDSNLGPPAYEAGELAKLLYPAGASLRESNSDSEDMGSLADFRGSCLGGCHTYEVSL